MRLKKLRFKKSFEEIAVLIVFMSLFFIILNIDVSMGTVQQEITYVDLMTNEAANAAQNAIIGYSSEADYNNSGISDKMAAEQKAREAAVASMNTFFAEYNLPGTIVAAADNNDNTTVGVRAPNIPNDGYVTATIDDSNFDKMTVTVSFIYRTGDIWQPKKVSDTDDKLTFDKKMSHISLRKTVVKKIENPKYYRLHSQS